MNIRLLRTNLLILLGYAVLIQVSSFFQGNDAGMLVLILMMFAVGAHVSVLIIGSLGQAIAKNNGKAAVQWLLNALLIGLIGFGTCWGGAALTDLYSSGGGSH